MGLPFCIRRKDRIYYDGTRFAAPLASGGSVFSIHVESVGDVAVVQCTGRIVHSAAAYRLRDVVLAQRNARVVVVELTEVDAIEGGGLGILAFLQRWAHDHNIKLKFFNPSSAVQEKLEHAWMPSLDVTTTDELIALLDRATTRRVEGKEDSQIAERSASI